MNVCTAPIGKFLFNINPDLIDSIEDINNDHSVVLFNVQLPARVGKAQYVKAKTYGIIDSQGKILVFGIATHRLLRSALTRIDRNAGSLVRKLLK